MIDLDKIERLQHKKWYDWIVFFPMLLCAVPSLIINIFIKHRFFCVIYGWHTAPLKQGFDGASENGICPVCGKEVLQDSQGNWF